MTQHEKNMRELALYHVQRYAEQVARGIRPANELKWAVDMAIGRGVSRKEVNTYVKIGKAWATKNVRANPGKSPKRRNPPGAGSGHFYRVTAHITEGKKTVVSKFRFFSSSKSAAIESICKVVGIPRSCIQSAKIIPRSEKKK